MKSMITILMLSTLIFAGTDTYPIVPADVSVGTDITISSPDANWNFRFYQSDAVYNYNYWGVAKTGNIASCNIYNTSGSLVYKVDSVSSEWKFFKNAKDINVEHTTYVNYVLVQTNTDTLYVVFNQPGQNAFSTSDIISFYFPHSLTQNYIKTTDTLVYVQSTDTLWSINRNAGGAGGISKTFVTDDLTGFFVDMYNHLWVSNANSIDLLNPARITVKTGTQYNTQTFFVNAIDSTVFYTSTSNKLYNDHNAVDDLLYINNGSTTSRIELIQYLGQYDSDIYLTARHDPISNGVFDTILIKFDFLRNGDSITYYNFTPAPYSYGKFISLTSAIDAKIGSNNKVYSLTLANTAINHKPKSMPMTVSSVNVKNMYLDYMTYTNTSKVYINSVLDKPTWMASLSNFAASRETDTSFMIFGTPAKLDSGSVHVKVVFTDSINYAYTGYIYDTLDYNFTVNYVNTQPTIDLPPTASNFFFYKLDTTCTKTFICSDVERDVISYRINNMSTRFNYTFSYKQNTNAVTSACTLKVTPIASQFTGKLYNDSIFVMATDAYSDTVISKQMIGTILLDTTVVGQKIDTLGIYHVRYDTSLNDSQQVFKDTSKVALKTSDIRRIFLGSSTVSYDTIQVSVDTIGKNYLTYNYVPKISNTVSSISFTTTKNCTLYVTDKDGDNLTYSYSLDGSYVTVSQTGNIYTFVAKKTGTFTATLSVTDNKITTTYTVQITINPSTGIVHKKMAYTTFYKNNIYGLEESGIVKIYIYNVQGQLVYSINEIKNAGIYTINFKRAGFYICKINLLNKINMIQKQLIVK